VAGGDPGSAGRTGPGGGPVGRDPEWAWRSGVALVLRVQWLVAVAAYLGLAYRRTAPYTVGALTGVLVLLGAFGWLRWQAEPPALRAAVARLPRVDRRAAVIVLLAGAGALGLVGIVPAAMLGELPAARVAVVLAVLATTGAAVAAGRRRAAGAVRPAAGAASAAPH
jgi:hypothetical protein